MTITPESAGSIGTPNTIAPESITTSPGGALIGYNNLLVSGAADDGSNPNKALVPNTHERWQPTATTVVARFQMASLFEIDFIGIAAHGMAGNSILIQTATTIGGALTNLDSIVFADNNPVMINFDSVSVMEVALTMTLSAANEIGVVYAGAAMQMPRSIYGGHAPQALAGKTSYQNSISENGNFLGRTIIRKGSATNLSWQHLDPSWYREVFQLFVESAKLYPFFIKWRPDKYAEVSYSQTAADIVPKNMAGGSGLMSVDVGVVGHDDVL